MNLIYNSQTRTVSSTSARSFHDSIRKKWTANRVIVFLIARTPLFQSTVLQHRLKSHFNQKEVIFRHFLIWLEISSRKSRGLRRLRSLLVNGSIWCKTWCSRKSLTLKRSLYLFSKRQMISNRVKKNQDQHTKL